MNTVITVELLRRLGACSEERSLFDRLFPDGSEVTVELCVQHASDFDWAWAAEKLLTFEACQLYNDDVDTHYRAQREAEKPIDDAYAEALKPFDDAYKAASTAARLALEKAESTLGGRDMAAREEYYAATDAAHAEYNDATKAIQEQFHAQLKAVTEQYERGQAAAFATAFLSEANVKRVEHLAGLTE